MTSPTPRQTEPSANTALAELLRGTLPGCQVRAEHTGRIAGRSGLRLDLRESRQNFGIATRR